MGRRIRVAHCIETMHLGGVEQTRLMLARGLDPERYEQILICTQAMGALPEQFEAAGCRVITVGTFERKIDPRVLARTRQALRAFRPDIVHGSVYEGVVMAALGGRAAGVPHIIAEESGDPHGRRWTGHLFFRAMTALSHLTVAVSPFVRDYLVGTLRIPQSKIRVIPNGVRPGTPTPADSVASLRLELGIEPGAPVLGFVGRLSENPKKVSDLIHALALLPERHKRTHLVLVGTGPDLPLYRHLAADLGAADRIHFAGYQGVTRPWFDLADIFVQSSVADAFPLSILEAMMAAKPVVATAVGGIPSMVAAEETGILVPANAPHTFASAVTRLLEDPKLRETFGQAGRARALAEFSDTIYVRQIARLYEQVMARR